MSDEVEKILLAIMYLESLLRDAKRRVGRDFNSPLLMQVLI